MVSDEKGEKWSNPIAELVSPSYLDGVELLQEGSEHFLLQWKYSEVNPSGFFSRRGREWPIGVFTSI